MTQDISFYLKLLYRRFPAMAALFLLCTCTGIVLALRQPPVYSASAILLVEASQIPSEMVRTTVQVDANEQLAVIQKRLMTRDNLLEVARENRVFPDLSTMHPNDIVREMRSRTQLRRSGGRNRADVMTVRFEGPNPRKVAAVANQYVEIIMEASNEFRSERVGGTLEFFEQEVNALSQQLDEQSAKIVAFKNENADALPEGLGFRLSRQSLLQERLSRAERDLEGLQQQREDIQKIYANTGTLSTANAASTPAHARLNKLQGQLDAALGIYSNSHPRVRLLQNQISVVEQQIQSAAAIELAASGSGEAEQVSALDVSLAEIDSRISSVTQQIADTTDALSRLQDAIDRTPANGIALEAMERDQQNLQGLYSGAVQRLSQARMGERIEQSAKGERVTVLEPATVPNAPSGPNRVKIMGAGAAGGVVLAGGLFMLLEMLNMTIRRPADIKRALNITPLATVPRFETQADRRRRRWVQFAMLAVVVIAVPSSLWLVDTYYMPLDVLFEKVMNRLT